MMNDVPLSKVINNFLAFQIGWFFSAYLHDPRVLVINGVLLLWLYHVEPWSKLRIKFTLMASLSGIVSDSVLTYLEFIDFGGSLFVPLWFASLWVLFVCTLSVSLSWIMKNKVFSMLGGAIFGPLAYWAGAQFGALTVNGYWGYGLISVTWMLLMLLFSVLYQRKPINRLYIKSSETR